MLILKLWQYYSKFAPLKIIHEFRIKRQILDDDTCIISSHYSIPDISSRVVLGDVAFFGYILRVRHGLGLVSKLYCIMIDRFMPIVT